MAWGEEEREKQREFAWRSNPLEIVIGTSGGTSDRWKIQPPLSLAFNASETFGYNGSCVRADECSN